MRKDTFREMTGILVRHHRHRTWQKIVSVLCCIVVFSTTYALILPAITLEEKPGCGKTEHIHSEACYTPGDPVHNTVLVCTPESINLHLHTDACLDESGKYCCGYSDVIIHKHDASCYDTEGKLWCPLPEVEAHIHGESCYAEPGTDSTYSHPEEGLTAGENSTAEENHSAEESIPEGESYSAEEGISAGENHPAEENLPAEQSGNSEQSAASGQDDAMGQSDTANENGGAAQSESAETKPEEERLLICGKTEITPHRHTIEECFATDEKGNSCLTCGKIQVLEHIHTDQCFQVVEEIANALTCSREEGEGAHAHSAEAGCYDEKGRLICKIKESEGHRHGTYCYGAWKLVCGLEEHTHSLICFSDPEADLETAQVWEDSVKDIVLTGDSRKDVLLIAESQLGCRESEKNYTVDEVGNKNGYTRYGAWYGDPYGEWCEMFIAFCLKYAGVDNSLPEVSCARWVEALQTGEKSFYHGKEEYAPQAGDLIFFDLDGDRSADRVGLVAELLAAAEKESWQIRTIEGDSDHCVQSVTYAKDDPQILGYGELPEKKPEVYQWSQDGLEVTVSFAKQTELPDEAELVVERLSPENEESAYEEKFNAVRDAVSEAENGAVAYIDLFRIYLEAGGEEILPQGEANVEIRLLEDQYPAMECTELLRYSEGGAETELIEPALDESGSLVGSFDTEMSAEYAVVGALGAPNSSVAPREKDTRETPDIVPQKTIDAFRDGANNPDTELDGQAIDQTDLYRLYLDAVMGSIRNPVDLLIVVDQSGSMQEDGDYMDMWDGDVKIHRDEAVRLVLNGTRSQNPADYEANKEKGLIYQFLSMNPENNVAVVGFQGEAVTGSNFFGKSYDSEQNSDAETLQNWTKSAGYINVEGKYFNGTNYCAGLLQAEKVLNDLKGNGHKKVMLFMSDGCPTFYLSGNWKYGSGKEMTNATVQNSKTYFDKLRDNHSELVTYTIGISKDITQDDGGNHNSAVLEYMATTGGGEYLGVESTEDLAAAIKRLILDTGYSELSINDTLSEYVDVYEAQPDFRVTMTNADGVKTVLYDKNGLTEKGKGILKDVIHEPGTKTVSAVFDSSYHLESGSTYTLSFNVKANQKVYDTYAKTGYPVSGDANTDYGGNATSSDQPGFYSNDSATLKYTIDTNSGELNYPHPVVQAVTCKIVVQKTDSKDPAKKLAGAVFALYRKAGADETGGESLGELEGKYVKIREGLTTDDSGQVVIDNLVPGNYWLVETKAPESYHQASDPIPVTLIRDTDGNGQIQGSDANITIGEENLPSLIVPNTSWGYILPSTGGCGTEWYTLGGLLTVCCSLFLLYHKEKRRKEDFASS